jgi:hypothetical protein
VIFQGFLRNFGKIQIPNGFPFNTKFFFSSELKLYRTFKKISKELSERVTSNEGCTSLLLFPPTTLSSGYKILDGGLEEWLKW